MLENRQPPKLTHGHVPLSTQAIAPSTETVPEVTSQVIQNPVLLARNRHEHLPVVRTLSESSPVKLHHDFSAFRQQEFAPSSSPCHYKCQNTGNAKKAPSKSPYHFRCGEMRPTSGSYQRQAHGQASRHTMLESTPACTMERRRNSSKCLQRLTREHKRSDCQKQGAR